MKKTIQILSLLILSVIIIPLLFSACNNSSTKTESNSLTDSTTDQNINIDSYEQEIAYYTELSQSLQNEILILKEEAYVQACEKDIRISELEKTVENLQKTISYLNNIESIRPNGDLHSPSLDQMVSKSDYEYKQIDGYIIITRYLGKETDITLPSEIGGLPVYEIGDYAFKDCSVLSVTIPSSIKKIGWFAFEGCRGLESVTIPSSVSSIGYGAFNYCSSSVQIVCDQGSYAESFAQSWGFTIIPN